MQTAGRQKRSRFHDLAPSGRLVNISDKDVALFQLLQEYRYLPSTYLAALLGASPSYFTDRLTRLRKDGGYIKCPPASWHAANARYRPAVYSLTAAGEQVLKERGLHKAIRKTSEPFAHEFGVCLARASFALGVRRHPSLHLIVADEILAHPSCPESTRHSKTPFQIPVSFTYTSPKSGARSAVSTFIKHDGRPFGIGHTRPDGTVTRIFFPGIEFDRRTEPLEPEDYDRSSIRKHIESIRELAKSGGYKAHYGIPNSIVPFVTINQAHMQSMMKIVERVTGGKGSKMFVFKSISDFSSFEKFPPPTGAMLTEPWQRVGYEPFDILKELGVK